MTGEMQSWRSCSKTWLSSRRCCTSSPRRGWNPAPVKPAAQFVVAIEDALAHDQPVLARTLSQQGHRLYPQDERLVRLATVLAPPRIIAADLPPDPDVSANMAWIKADRAEYTGQWVAVAAGVLRGVASSLGELKATVGDLRGMLVTRVL